MPILSDNIGVLLAVLFRQYDGYFLSLCE